MTNSPNKKVSAVIPNYNYAKYLKKRIWSVVRQTYPIFELIVLDDASSDGSAAEIEKILAKVKERHPNLSVKFIPNEKNSGKSITQWKKAFEVARGDYIWIAEADDLCARGFLAEAMKGFEDPEVVLSYTESKIINEWGIMIAPNFRWSRDKEKSGHYVQDYIKNGQDEIREIMAIRCTIPNVSAVIMRRDPKYIKYLDEVMSFRQVGDWYFYTKILENGKIAYSRKALNKFRVHGGSVTAGSKKSAENLQEVKEMHEMLGQKYKLSEDVKNAMRHEELRLATKYGKME